MPRPTVKLLLLDAQDRLLLIQSRDLATGEQYWYPVGGGIEAGETLQEAASREAWEETGLAELPAGDRVWTRRHTYRYAGRVVDVHEDWLLHRVEQFGPSPTGLTEYETETVAGFRWWSAAELDTTSDTVFPPRLGRHLARLLADGVPEVPIDISE